MDVSHLEALHMFKKRLHKYMENQDLLTIKQKDFSAEARTYVEQEIRSQRLIEAYCQMCETHSRQGKYQQMGTLLQEELTKTDQVTEEECQMINNDCDKLYG